MTITNNLHGFVWNSISNDCFPQMKKPCINAAKNQVTCSTSDDIYYGHDVGELDANGSVHCYSYGSKTVNSSVEIDPHTKR